MPMALLSFTFFTQTMPRLFFVGVALVKLKETVKHIILTVFFFALIAALLMLKICLCNRMDLLAIKTSVQGY
jgi:hypothetical protein